MRLSTKGRYGVRILLDLAVHCGEGPRSLTEISVTQHISQKYMSRLLPVLVRAGIVESLRGSEGGYRLLRDPASLTFLEIVEIMEGPLRLAPCLGEKSCPRHERCPVSGVWGKLTEAMRKAMADMTLQDVVDAGGDACL